MGTVTPAELPPTPNGNTLLVGGSVVTMNTDNALAEALTYNSEGEILAVGSEAEVSQAAGDGALRIELNGAQVLPGFHDVHLHAVEAGINEARCLLSEFGTLNQYRSEINDCAADQQRSDWFIGAGVSMPDLLDRTERPIDLLDELHPDKPALVLDNLGHGAWANSMALEAVGFNSRMGNPNGGVIGRDSNGAPNGVVFENAQQVLRTAALPPSVENLEDNYQALLVAQETLLANGITSVSDAGGYWPRGHNEAWLRAEQEGTLKLRASNALYVFPDRDTEQQISDIQQLMRSDANALVRFDQVKIYVDGIISQGTASLLQPYTQPPEIADVSSNGFEYFSEEALNLYARRFDAMGLGLHFHATGDRGVRLALNAIENAQNANSSRSTRHRVTHLFLVDESDIPRFAELGVVADVQVTPSSTNAETIEFYRGLLGNRADSISAANDLFEANAPMTVSSDWDADQLSPLLKLSGLIGRESQGIVDAMAVLRMQTIESAILLGQETLTGSLEPGKRADLAIVDGNLLELTSAEIANSRVQATIFNGEAVYDPGNIFP